MMVGEKPITDAKVRMYKMGTGDCISVKFMHKDEVTYSMLFDCGCINGSKTKLTPFVKELIRDLEGHVDALVVTHEHQDHVLGFQRCEDIFVEGLSVGELWMGWTEDDTNSKVKRWKKEFGEKKNALAIASNRINSTVKSAEFKRQLKGSLYSDELYSFHQGFAASVQDFASLHVNELEDDYKGPLKGMEVVKEKMHRDYVKYMSPGEIYSGIEGLDGVNIYVLGPPKKEREVDKEKGETGDTYRHNKDLDPEEFQLNKMRNDLDESNYFIETMNHDGHIDQQDALVPFSSDKFASSATLNKSVYEEKHLSWRRIDNEWLESSAHLALRMNSLTNNLSLVLAIEFENTGKVMLFPGDAEFGSWESWHDINWAERFPEDDISTERLLNNTVFYKVAHHLSHNGTAQAKGLEMMTHPELVAMATLNYDVISNGWKSTMPNRAILKELLERTKGRTLIQNTDGMFFDLEEQVLLQSKIEEFQKRMSADEKQQYIKSIKDTRRYIEITLPV